MSAARNFAVARSLLDHVQDGIFLFHDQLGQIVHHVIETAQPFVNSGEIDLDDRRW